MTELKRFAERMQMTSNTSDYKGCRACGRMHDTASARECIEFYDELVRAQQWVSVGERLPPEPGDYPVWGWTETGGKVADEAHFDGMEFDCRNVQGWRMPLLPPEEQ